VSSTDKSSEFEDSDTGAKPKEKPKKKKNKKIRKDKRTSLVKSKLNLQQVLGEAEKKERRWVANFQTCRAKGSLKSNYKLCAICNSVSNYACPRCWDRVCNLRCMRYHREFVCIHVEMGMMG
jgi:hypothetical protein